MTRLVYERDAAAIYRQSFATIRAEADLALVPADLEPVVVRMIHACGMTDLPALVAASPDVVAAARAALVAGRPVFCDSMMVANGITRARLPAPNPVRCTLQEPGIADDARAAGTTRSAAAVDRWRPDLTGAVVVIGNAPTALAELVSLPVQPALVVGLPVGFVGAAEAKAALLRQGWPCITNIGEKGGSAVAAAAVNALVGLVRETS